MAADISVSVNPIEFPRSWFRGYRARLCTITYSGTFAAAADCAISAAECKLSAITGMSVLGITDGYGTIIGAIYDKENGNIIPIMADGQVPTNDNLANCAILCMVIGT